MPDIGHFVAVDLSSVKTKAEKTIKFLTDTLSKRKSNQRLVIVFLGEEHNNQIDMQVTQALLTSPPIFHPGHSRVLFERGLSALYFPNANFLPERDEPVNLSLTRQARSKLIADMVLDLFENQNDTLIYIPCGSAHGKEIFDALNKRARNPFTYICKMSVAD